MPTGQALEYYRALRIRNKPVKLVFYPREGHGLSECCRQLNRAWRQYRWIAAIRSARGRCPGIKQQDS